MTTDEMTERQRDQAWIERERAENLARARGGSRGAMTPVQLPEVPALTPAERGFIEVVRMNGSRKIIGVSKRAIMLGHPVSFSWRSRKNPMGRFGGGWQWKLGFQAGGGTVIISILVCELIINRRRKAIPIGDQQ